MGRFAPSPTGPLHEGSLVAALASWLDARFHAGRWLVRIEDVDGPRCSPAHAATILEQLQRLGLEWDGELVYQSLRADLYRQALQRLVSAGWAYPCGCTRKEVPGLYPGTCAAGLNGKTARSTRLRTRQGEEEIVLDWHDRWLGPQRQNLTREVGDFVLHRADGIWAYQLAVVVDDADQGITHVVRGQDLADNTPRQLHLQRLLGVPHPEYLHTPLVLAADGQKLSKQTGATAVDLTHPVAALQRAAEVLGLPPIQAETPGRWLEQAVRAWPGQESSPGGGA